MLDTHVMFDDTSRAIFGYCMLWGSKYVNNGSYKGQPQSFWYDGRFEYKCLNGTPILINHDPDQLAGWIYRATKTQDGLFVTGYLYPPRPDDPFDMVALQAAAGALFFSASGPFYSDEGAYLTRLKGGPVDEVSLTLAPALYPRHGRREAAMERLEYVIEALDLVGDNWGNIVKSHPVGQRFALGRPYRKAIEGEAKIVDKRLAMKNDGHLTWEYGLRLPNGEQVTLPPGRHQVGNWERGWKLYIPSGGEE